MGTVKGFNVGVLLLVLLFCPAASCMDPPIAPKESHLRVMFNDSVVDDYFYLRNKSDPVVVDYVEAENAYTNHIFSQTRELQVELLAEFIGSVPHGDLEDVPLQIGNFTYYSKMEQGKEYDIWYRNSTAGDEEVVLDLNEIAEKYNASFLALGVLVPSPDGSLVAYNTDLKGNEVFNLYIKNMTDGVVLPEVIPSTFYAVEWSSDSRCLFYNKITRLLVQGLEVWRHTIGTFPDADVLVHNETDETFYVQVSKTNSQDYILVIMNGLQTSEVRYLKASDPYAEPTILFPRQENVWYEMEHRGDNFYVRTNAGGAYNFKVVQTPVNDTSVGSDLIPHNESVLITGLLVYKHSLVTWVVENTLQQIDVYNFTTMEVQRVPVPQGWYGLEGERRDEGSTPLKYSNFDTTQVRFSYTSFLTPYIFFSYDMETKVLTELGTRTVQGYDPSLYVEERIYVPGTDGVEIPVTLAYQKGLRDDGEPHPLWLYGYGAYGSIIYPWFSGQRLSILNRGIIYALAHVRGDATRGSLWYINGRTLTKKNTFNDMISCLEYFESSGWTTADQVAIEGRSAGGLLMGALLTERPDLFNAVYAQVPFLDVVNTMSDPTITYVISEYCEWGNPDNETFYWYMKSYDPYQKVTARDYPHVLFTTGWNDFRVLYWEPTKTTAKMRAMKTDSNTLILQVLNSGHMGGSGTSYYEDMSNQYAFILDKIMPRGKEAPAKRAPHIVIIVITSVVVFSVLLAVITMFAARRFHAKVQRNRYQMITKN